MKCPSCGKETVTHTQDYRYVEAGLKNVILKDLTVHRCRKCAELLPEIPNIEGLHRLLAFNLVKKDSPLTGEEFRFLRKNIGMSARELADILGVTPVTISRWENGKENIGTTSDRFIRLMYIAKSSPSLKPAGFLTRPAFFEGLKTIMLSIADKTPKPVHVEVNKKKWEAPELIL